MVKYKKNNNQSMTTTLYLLMDKIHFMSKFGRKNKL